ncbi:NAD(+)/NADH kinase [Desulfofustis limnaeus]|jgi:NAD+ kinase|uniref:NAD kinase n=1 Tax=Desulfofustis limnaeus TaxID=2740163 RepID=A0ABM7W845_9BACT|nr:NAD(+)/NADH kinase [Desulfofustis limnaeus]MDX9894558.1 NAD(+)/NADH kinase [Desulfofustis sp.]BDD87064.1 NAD kinase [Desulfofustis limnaeus]
MNKQIQQVGIITKKDAPEAADYAAHLRRWLQDRAIETRLDEIRPHLDLLIILGGDGTLLHVAEKAARLDIPVIGVNLGNLGFLTELTRSESESALEEIIAGSIIMERRMMIKARLLRNGRHDEYRHALNDIVVTKNATDRLLYLTTNANGDTITTYQADGLVFSTPTGSTAYNLSAGGPLVHPELQAVLVTPICPFMLSSRPVIVPPDVVLTSEFVSHEHHSRAKVIVDGQRIWDMQPGDILEVRQSEHFLQLISSTRRDYFTILRNKLKWGSA